MQYARDDRARKIVDAHDIVEAARRRAYSCPKCGARVHFRRSMALSPEPGFAHNPHEGKPDCDDYYPGSGTYVQTPFPDRPIATRAVEDRLEEFGLCLEDEAPWSIYLRVPELSKSELESTTLRSLAR